MAEKLTRSAIAAKAIVHAEPALRVPTQVDRSFELPTALYGATVGLFLGYLAIMGLGFAHPEMILPMAIFTLFIVAGFGVPALWVRMNPDSGQQALSWSRFKRDGIQTLTGRLDATAARCRFSSCPP